MTSVSSFIRTPIAFLKACMFSRINLHLYGASLHYSLLQ